MTARRKNEPGGRNIIYKIRLSEPEQKRLQVMANSRNITVSRLLAESALTETDAVQSQVWANELRSLKRQVRETGCTPELDAKILDLLRRISE